MKNSEVELNRRSASISKKLIFVLVAASFIGFLDATYLTAKYYFGGPIPCAILNGCEEVVTSKYSAIFGVPVSLLGTAYYLIGFVLSLAYLDLRNYRLVRFIARFTVLGLLASIWLLFAQIFILHSLCFYCVISAVSSSVLFVSGLFIIKSGINRS